MDCGIAVDCAWGRPLPVPCLDTPSTTPQVIELEIETDSLLRRIPKHVAYAVPAIRAYLRTGTLPSSALEDKKALQETDTMLATMLPPSIAARLKAGENPIAELCRDVTVLFTHLVGFTHLTTVLGPRELVGLLNAVFCEFDKMVAARGLEKIKTVGDGYMMAGNLLKKTPHGARAVVECGLAMLKVLEEINGRHGAACALEQTTGVNTGHVVAGVLGYTTVAFDIWGDAVNCASRMESNSVPSVVQVAFVWRSAAVVNARVKSGPHRCLRTCRAAGHSAVAEIIAVWRLNVWVPRPATDGETETVGHHSGFGGYL